jgi:hypothetical protein
MPGIAPFLMYVFLGLGVVIQILFCLSLIKTIALIDEKNRKISPHAVWLLLVPAFGTLWIFFVANRLAASLKLELLERNFDVNTPPTLVIGMIYAVLSGMVWLIPAPADLKTPNPALGILALAILIAFIQYWVKVNWYKKVLEKDNAESYHD